MALDPLGPPRRQDRPFDLGYGLQKRLCVAMKEDGPEVDGLPIESTRSAAPAHAPGAVKHQDCTTGPMKLPAALQPRDAPSDDDHFVLHFHFLSCLRMPAATSVVLLASIPVHRNRVPA
jgi:hypothetical protein